VSSDVDPIGKLRGIPEFWEFARQKMNANPERWQREATHGVGFARQLAEAIVAIGGGGQRGP